MISVCVALMAFPMADAGEMPAERVAEPPAAATPTESAAASTTPTSATASASASATAPAIAPAPVSTTATAPASSTATTPAAGALPADYDAIVTDERALVFEQPSELANVIRRVYVGEVLHTRSERTTDDGRRWVEVALGQDLTGFVDASQIAVATDLPTELRRPPRVIREERPIALLFKVGGETQGMALGVRYQGFSRIGLAFNVGTMMVGEGGALGNDALKVPSGFAGTVFSGGIVSAPLLWNLSPILEVGLSHMRRDKGNAECSITAMYASLGIEWIFDHGAFFGTNVSYTRGISERVSFALGDAKAGQMEVPDFGGMEPGTDGVFEKVEIGAVTGYAF